MANWSLTRVPKSSHRGKIIVSYLFYFFILFLLSYHLLGGHIIFIHPLLIGIIHSVFLPFRWLFLNLRDTHLSKSKADRHLYCSPVKYKFLTCFNLLAHLVWKRPDWLTTAATAVLAADSGRCTDGRSACCCRQSSALASWVPFPSTRNTLRPHPRAARSLVFVWKCVAL